MYNYSKLTKQEEEAARREKALKRLYKKSISEVAKEYNVSRQTIHNWRKQRNIEGHLKPKQRGGSKQKPIYLPEERLIQIIQTQTPIGLGYTSKLWNIAVVKEMIWDTCGTAISSYKTKQFLRNWGFYPQKNNYNWWANYISQSTDNTSLSAYASKTKRQLYLMNFLRDRTEDGVCGVPLFLVPVVMRVYHTYPSCLEEGGA